MNALQSLALIMFIYYLISQLNNPDTIELEDGFTRDVRNIGHYGTGELRIVIKSISDFEKAKKYIDKAYEIN